MPEPFAPTLTPYASVAHLFGAEPLLHRRHRAVNQPASTRACWPTPDLLASDQMGGELGAIVEVQPVRGSNPVSSTKRFLLEP